MKSISFIAYGRLVHVIIRTLC